MGRLCMKLPPNTLFAFALEREAKPFRRRCPTADIVVTSAGSVQAIAAITKAISLQRPNAVVMSGFAGALASDLKVGDIVVATDVVDLKNVTDERLLASFQYAARSELTANGDSPERERRIAFQPSLALRAVAITPNLPVPGTVSGRHGRILSASRIIATATEKRELGLLHDAIAVDMESAAVAQVCNENRIPWAAVRVISDMVDTELSSEMIKLVNGGKVSIAKTMRALLRKPSLLKEFRRLARDTRIASERLAQFLSQFVTTN